MRETVNRWFAADPVRATEWKEYLRREFESLSDFLRKIQVSGTQETFDKEFDQIRTVIGGLQNTTTSLINRVVQLEASSAQGRLFKLGIDNLKIPKGHCFFTFTGDFITGTVTNDGLFICV